MSDENTMVSILSVDAWASPCNCGDEDCAENHYNWEWNQWFKVGEAPLKVCDLDPGTLIEWMIGEGYLTPAARTLATIDDDQYNVVIVDKSDNRPIFAIAYGEAF